MKVPLKVDSPITSKIYMYKIWGIIFCKNNTGVEIMDPRMHV